MKRYNNLYDQIISLENLSFAFDKATKNKTWRNNIQRCIKHKDQIIKSIHLALKREKYHTSKYKLKTIYEPKERLIYILPFAPDRVVHHAIMRVIEPILERKLVDDTYSCRIGKGQIKACDRCTQYVKRYRYVLQLDISKFYPSINHQILKNQLACIFKDKRLLNLLSEIIDSVNTPKNVPIGNYLSQWFGNIYLNSLDRFCIHNGFSKIVRYCDDLLIFSDDKQSLNQFKSKAIDFLHQVLDLKTSRADIIRTSKGIKFLGYRHFPNGLRLLKRKTATRIKERLKDLPQKLSEHKIHINTARGQVASALGWLSHCNSYNLQQSINFACLCSLTNVNTELIVKDVNDFLEPKEQLGVRLPINMVLNKPVAFYGAKICTRKQKEYLRLHFKLLNSNLKENNCIYVTFTESKRLMYLFQKYQSQLPFTARLIRTTKAYCLTSIRGDSMKGFPKHLNSKADYLYVKDNFEKDLWLPEFKKLLDSMQDWVFIKTLDKESDGLSDDTHKVVPIEDMTDSTKVTYSQYELQTIPTSKIFRLGFTVDEVNQIINS